MVWFHQPYRVLCGDFLCLLLSHCTVQGRFGVGLFRQGPRIVLRLVRTRDHHQTMSQQLVLSFNITLRHPLQVRDGALASGRWRFGAGLDSGLHVNQRLVMLLEKLLSLCIEERVHLFFSSSSSFFSNRMVKEMPFEGEEAKGGERWRQRCQVGKKVV